MKIGIIWRYAYFSMGSFVTLLASSGHETLHPALMVGGIAIFCALIDAVILYFVAEVKK